MSEDIWDKKTAYIKAFWGWTPETWASIGFGNERRKRLITESTDPFIMVIYATKTSKLVDKNSRGKIFGFYVVSHEKGHRDEFTHPKHHNANPDKWQNAIRAIRAFNFLEEYRLDIDELDSNISNRSTAKDGKKLTPEQIEQLKSIPYQEVPIYKGTFATHHSPDAPIHVAPSANKVRGGPANRSGYMVGGEPEDTPKELYALILKGGGEYFLDPSLNDHNIYKIGLSMSPETRLKNFQKSMPQTHPEGKIKWEIHKTTKQDDDHAYPNFETALKGEEAMKDFLAKNALHLGGEFYAATEAQFAKAWAIGRTAARS